MSIYKLNMLFYNYFKKEKDNRVKRYAEIVRSRSSPGILILDSKDKLVYFNQEALDYIPDLKKGKVLPAIVNLCQKVRAGKNSTCALQEEAHFLIIKNVVGIPVSFRAFPLQERTTKDGLFILVLVEKIVDRHQADLDFKKIGRGYGLSQRETEVLELMSHGLSNKEIARRLFISEYTVKDHIKKIMRKMAFVSRSEVLADLIKPRKKED